MGSATGGPNHQDCFVLKWNDFPTNVVTNLQEMRDENDFYDVTLACDELYEDPFSRRALGIVTLFQGHPTKEPDEPASSFGIACVNLLIFMTNHWKN